MYGAYLKAARIQAGLSPVEMAAAIGYDSADMIYKIERGASNPSIDQMEKWATACNQLIGDVLPNSGTSSLDQSFQPLISALIGLSDEEIADQILILASQARLNRNAILRRVNTQVVEKATNREHGTYSVGNHSESADEKPRRYGVDEGGDDSAVERPTNALRRHPDQASTPTAKRRTR